MWFPHPRCLCTFPCFAPGYELSWKVSKRKLENLRLVPSSPHGPPLLEGQNQAAWLRPSWTQGNLQNELAWMDFPASFTFAPHDFSTNLRVELQPSDAGNTLRIRGGFACKILYRFFSLLRSSSNRFPARLMNRQFCHRPFCQSGLTLAHFRPNSESSEMSIWCWIIYIYMKKLYEIAIIKRETKVAASSCCSQESPETLLYPEPFQCVFVVCHAGPQPSASSAWLFPAFRNRTFVARLLMENSPLTQLEWLGKVGKGSLLNSRSAMASQCTLCVLKNASWLGCIFLYM